MAEGGSGGNGNKVAALLLGGGLVAILSIFGPPLLDGDDSEPDSDPTPIDAAADTQGQASVPPPTSAPRSTQQSPVSVPTKPPDDDLRGDPNNVILTIIAYGMPARVSAHASNRSISVRERFREFCTPETVFPNPCIVDYVVPRGTEMVVTAGDSRAGYWPLLESLTGGGCKLSGGSGQDQICTITLISDLELEARYYGDDSRAPFFAYPNCPPPAENQPAWLSRCQK